MRPKHTVLSLTTAFVFSVIAGLPAQAAFKLSLTDTSCGAVGGAANPCNITITDNGAGDLLSSTGSIMFGNAVGPNFTTNLVTGVSKPILGSGNPGELNITSFNLASTGAGTLVLRLTDTGFTAPSEPYLYSLTNRLTVNSLSPPGLVTVSAYGSMSSSNLEFASEFQTPLQTLNAVNASVVKSDEFAVTGPYSLTEYITVTFKGAGNVSLTKNLTLSAPEPSSVVLLSGVLVFTAHLIRRRRRSASAQRS